MVRMEARLPKVSIDTLHLVGVDEGGVFEELLHSALSTSGHIRPCTSLYDWCAYFPDQTTVRFGNYRGFGDEPRRVRIELNPSRVDKALVDSFISVLSRVSVVRLDVALDYLEDIELWTAHATMLGYTQNKHSHRSAPHSYRFGEGRSPRQVVFYDKLAALKAKKDKNPVFRRVDIFGEVEEYLVTDLIASGQPLMRFEVRLKGEWILGGAEPRVGAFDDLLINRRQGLVSEELDLRTEATLLYLRDNPTAITRLSKRSRARYRKLQRAWEAQCPLDPHPKDVLTAYHGYICEAVRQFLPNTEGRVAA